MYTVMTVQRITPLKRWKVMCLLTLVQVTPKLRTG